MSNHDIVRRRNGIDDELDDCYNETIVAMDFLYESAVNGNAPARGYLIRNAHSVLEKAIWSRLLSEFSGEVCSSMPPPLH